jgi:FkbM family methyltransferase
VNTCELKALTRDLTNAWSHMPKKQALRWYCNIISHAHLVVRDKKLYSADAQMTGELEFFLDGHRFAFDADAIEGNPFAFFREMFLRQIYFRAFDLRRIPFQYCVDVGCNQGVVSCVLKGLGGPDAIVIGVDAEDFSSAGLQHNSPSLFDHIRIVRHFVCGTETRKSPLRVQLLAEEVGCSPESAISMDDLFRAYSISQVDFLKMDVEGSEFTIFCEDATWLRRVDNLAMEVHRSKGKPQLIVRILEEKGFKTCCADHFGIPTSVGDSDLIYASKVGALREDAQSLSRRVASSYRSGPSGVSGTTGGS